MGTGGGVKRLALGLPGSEPVFVMNADLLFEPDLTAALEAHRRHGAFATMVVRTDPRAEQFGAIEHTAAGRVHRIIGKPSNGQGAAEVLEARMFTGVHVLSRAALLDLPDEGCIIRQGYLRWLARGEVVAAHVDESPWRDVGDVASLFGCPFGSGSRAIELAG